MTQARLHSARIDVVALGGEQLESELLQESDPGLRRHLGNANPQSEPATGDQH